MEKTKTILFDLDGTLTDTMHPEFAKYRDGKDTLDISRVPVFPGARKIVDQLKIDGNQVFIVSDSHPRFVEPIARDIFGVRALSLAYKPSTEKIKPFINQYSQLKLNQARSRIILVGDTILDIQTARKLEVPSVQLIHETNYTPEVWSTAQKAGPTFCCRGFNHLYDVISDPRAHLLVLEGLEYSDTSKGELKINQIDYKASASKKLYKIALARQESGLCDVFGKAKWYHEFGSMHRSPALLSKLAKGIARYIQQFVESRQMNFDLLSFVPDKKTTKPPQKMEQFAHLIECKMEVQKIMQWKDSVKGSIRNQPHRSHRYKFVREFLEMNPEVDILGKNLIIVDDQITTGATMDAVADLLWDHGANHILFIGLFFMIEEVAIGKLCSGCGKQMSQRRRKADNQSFYSCVPAKYGGVGCGHIENI